MTASPRELVERYDDELRWTLPGGLAATLVVLALNETEGPVTLARLVERAEMPYEFVASHVAALRVDGWIVDAHPDGRCGW